MNVSATPDYQTEYLEFRFECVAQNVFSRSHRLADEFCCDEAARQMLQHCPPFLSSKFRYGVDVLSRFGQAHEGILKVTFSDARAALDVVMFALIYRADMAQEIAPLPLCALALARTTPYPVPVASLPPTDEALHDSAIPDTARSAYEKLRLWEKPGPAYMTLRGIYELALVLSKVNTEDSAPLTLLHRELISHSRIFKIAMRVAAEVEIRRASASKN